MSVTSERCYQVLLLRKLSISNGKLRQQQNLIAILKKLQTLLEFKKKTNKHDVRNIKTMPYHR